jgi:hypothetical protein
VTTPFHPLLGSHSASFLFCILRSRSVADTYMSVGIPGADKRCLDGVTSHTCSVRCLFVKIYLARSPKESFSSPVYHAGFPRPACRLRFSYHKETPRSPLIGVGIKGRLFLVINDRSQKPRTTGALQHEKKNQLNARSFTLPRRPSKFPSRRRSRYRWPPPVEMKATKKKFCCPPLVLP